MPLFKYLILRKIKKILPWHIFCLSRNQTAPDPDIIWNPAKQGPKGEKMIQRENKRQSRHKAPKFKETHEAELCWEDRQEIQNHKKKSGKRSHQKNKEKSKW